MRRKAAYAALLDRLPVGVCAVGAKGRVLYHNDAARELLGETATLEGRDLCRLLCGRLTCGHRTALAACPFKRPRSRAGRAVLHGVHSPPPKFRWRLVSEEMRRVQRRSLMTVVCEGTASGRRLVWFAKGVSAGSARGSPGAGRSWPRGRSRRRRA